MYRVPDRGDDRMPGAIRTPGIFVHRMIAGPDFTKPIEKRTVRQKAA